MPYQVNVDEKARTIAIRGTGSGTTADTLQLIRDQAATFKEHAGFSLLYDSSEMDIQSSAADMMTVAKTLFEEAGTSFGRIALVVPDAREELARIFAALAHPYGVTANIFSDASDARKWLRNEL